MFLIWLIPSAVAPNAETIIVVSPQSSAPATWSDRTCDRCFFISFLGRIMLTMPGCSF